MKMSYTGQIRCRVALLAAGILLMLAYMVLVGETGGGDSRVMSDFARGVANFIFFCGLGVMVWRLAHNCKLLGDRRRLKEQLLKEREERARSLHTRSGGLAMDVTLLALLFITMTAGMYNMAAFYTAFAGPAAASAAKAGSYLYFSRRA